VNDAALRIRRAVKWTNTEASRSIQVPSCCYLSMHNSDVRFFFDDVDSFPGCVLHPISYIEMTSGHVAASDLFWEAVWPHLLTKGWHSEQQEDVRSTKNNCLVFLVPDIEKFCRSKLTKETHYFDSVMEVLKTVAIISDVCHLLCHCQSMGLSLCCSPILRSQSK
jgi:hypothetical protein